MSKGAVILLQHLYLLLKLVKNFGWVCNYTKFLFYKCFVMQTKIVLLTFKPFLSHKIKDFRGQKRQGNVIYYLARKYSFRFLHTKKPIQGFEISQTLYRLKFYFAMVLIFYGKAAWHNFSVATLR